MDTWLSKGMTVHHLEDPEDPPVEGQPESGNGGRGGERRLSCIIGVTLLLCKRRDSTSLAATDKPVWQTTALEPGSRGPACHGARDQRHQGRAHCSEDAVDLARPTRQTGGTISEQDNHPADGIVRIE